jgi:hypothetical protein
VAFICGCTPGHPFFIINPSIANNPMAHALGIKVEQGLCIIVFRSYNLPVNE